MKRNNTGKSPAMPTGQGYWFSFSAYEIVSLGGGHRHVRPAKKAAVSFYRPFEHYRKILLEYLKLGRSLSTDQVISDASPDEEAKRYLDRENRNAGRIAVFAKKYGLPGTLWQCNPQSPHLDVGSTQVFVQNSLWSTSISDNPYESSTGLIDTAKLLGYFLVDNFSMSDVFRCERPFLKAYAEPVRCVERDAVDLYMTAAAWHRFREGGYSPNDSYIDRDGERSTITWTSYLEDGAVISSVDLAVRLNENKHDIQLDYSFHSLIAALRIMFAMNTASGATGQVRLCALPECGEPFIARYERARFCDPSHSNTARQRALLDRDPDYYRDLKLKKRKIGARTHGRKHSRQK